MRKIGMAVLLAAASALVAPGTARADKLDGHWCAEDGRTLSIDGPALVTPGGMHMTGDYARHTFSYVAPAGEPDAGTEVFIQQINDETMQLRPRPEAEFEIWTRCDFTS